MTEERLEAIRLRSQAGYSPWSSATSCDSSDAVADVRVLLAALEEAEQRGFVRGVEAAAKLCDKQTQQGTGQQHTFNPFHWRECARFLGEAIRALLPTTAPAEEGKND